MTSVKEWGLAFSFCAWGNGHREDKQVSHVYMAVTLRETACSHASLKLGRLRQEELKFKANLYSIVSPKGKAKGGWVCSSGAECLPKPGGL